MIIYVYLKLMVFWPKPTGFTGQHNALSSQETLASFFRQALRAWLLPSLGGGARVFNTANLTRPVSQLARAFFIFHFWCFTLADVSC